MKQEKKTLTSNNKELYYWLIANNINDIVHITSVEGTIEHVSPSQQSALGFLPILIEGREIYEFVHEDDVSLLRYEIHQLKRTKETRLLSVRLKQKHGECAYAEMNIVPCLNEANELNQLLFFSRILEQKTESPFIHNESVFTSGSWEFNLLNQHLSWSDEVFKIFCLPKDTINLSFYYNHIHPEDVERITRVFNHCIKNLHTYDVTYRIVHPDGTIRWLHQIGNIMKQTDGCEQCYRYVGTIQDITESISKSEEVTRLKRQKELILNSAGDGIYGIDLNATITFINPAAAKMLGYTQEELLHSSPLETFKSRYTAENCSVYATLQHGSTKFIPDDIFVRKDGSEFLGEYICAPIIENGKVTGAVVAFRDITKRKKSEQEIIRLKNQLELILHSIGDGIYAMDRNKKIKLINPAGAKLLGYETEELIGKSPFDTFRHCYEFNKCMPYQTLLDGNVRHVKDESFTRRDGSSFPTEYVCSPIREEGEITGVVVAFKDITEKKMAEEYLLKSEKLELVGQLAAGVAHEIRNPLTSIQGFIQLFEDGLSKPEYFSIIKSEFNRIQDIISEFLTLSKPSVVTFHKHNIGELLDNTIKLMNTQAILHDISVISEINTELPEAYCNASLLKQVFINIIKNSIEATPAKGQLKISCKQSGSSLHILFEDKGVGIPKERLKHLFEPFYSTKEKGTGLGLMISYKIIEEHKGTIRVESEEGKGTAVHILLPIQHSQIV